MNNLTNKIKSLLSEKQNSVIAIDGRAGAGKSTLADKLGNDFDGAVIHMDHFFLPPHLRGEKRPNVHYERFLEEVYPYIKEQMPFSYRIFDCSRMDYHGAVDIEMKPLIIIEGAYSLLPFWQDIIDLRIFCDIDPAHQKARILGRNGIDGYRAFAEKWIPLEEAYIKEYSVIERSDILIPSPPVP